MPLKRRMRGSIRYTTPRTRTSATSISPSMRTTTSTVSGGTTIQSPSLPTPSGPKGTPGTVVLIGLLLFFSVTYNDFWKPFFSTWYGGLQGQPLQTNIDGRLVLGGILFLVIAGFIASTSPDAGGIMIMIMIAMWLVYITVGQGGKQLNTFFGWFQQPSSGSTTPAPTLPKGGAGITKQ